MNSAFDLKLRRKNRKKLPKLNLVSLMDIFTILVFFLLVNSSNVEVLKNDKTLSLPVSIAEKKPDETLVVTVTKNAIIVGGRKVAGISFSEKLEDQNLLGFTKEMKLLAGQSSNNILKKDLDLTIMADKSAPYALLKQIMKLSANEGYRNISLAVSQVKAEVTNTKSSDPVTGV